MKLLLFHIHFELASALCPIDNNHYHYELTIQFRRPYIAIDHEQSLFGFVLAVKVKGELMV